MRHRIALILHRWSLRIGGPSIALAVRQAVVQQLRAEQTAAARAQAQTLARHRRRVAGIAQSN